MISTVRTKQFSQCSTDQNIHLSALKIPSYNLRRINDAVIRETTRIRVLEAKVFTLTAAMLHDTHRGCSPTRRTYFAEYSWNNIKDEQIPDHNVFKLLYSIYKYLQLNFLVLQHGQEWKPKLIRSEYLCFTFFNSLSLPQVPKKSYQKNKFTPFPRERPVC